MNPLIKVTPMPDSFNLAVGGIPTRVRVYFYTIGPHGPFELRIPLNEDSAAMVQQKTEAHLAQLQALNAV